MQEITMFRCDICGKPFPRLLIGRHEIECKTAMEKSNAAHKEYIQKCEDRLEAAKTWASCSDPVLLLVRNGFDEEAKTLCKEWARWNLWDCGTSHGWENVFNEMIKAAKGSNSPVPSIAIPVIEHMKRNGMI